MSMYCLCVSTPTYLIFGQFVSVGPCAASNIHLFVYVGVFQGDQASPKTEAGCGSSDCLG